MNGAIFFASKYGSTAEYARWIGEATGLPVFNVRDSEAAPNDFDFLVLGSPVIYLRLFIAKWVRSNLAVLAEKPIVVFTVSGAQAGEKLDRWIAKSLPGNLLERMDHFALRGRQRPKELSLFDRVMLTIAGLVNPDRQAGREERHGFDYMDQEGITPIVRRIEELKARDADAPRVPAAAASALPSGLMGGAHEPTPPMA